MRISHLSPSPLDSSSSLAAWRAPCEASDHSAATFYARAQGGKGRGGEGSERR